MIPKTIHCIWLGNNAFDKTTLMCMDSWKRNLKDYKIKIWRKEDLFLKELMKENKFLRKCNELKLWAFMSDYLRLHILYNYGGIYLDTDVEVLYNFNAFLDNKMFLGYEGDDDIGTGIIGSEKKNVAIKRLLQFYDTEIWESDIYQNPLIFKEVLRRDPCVFQCCKIYENSYFAPYNPLKKMDPFKISNKKTICIHWYNSAWGMTLIGYVFLKNKHVKNRMIKLIYSIRRILGYMYLKLLKRI